MVKVAWFRFQQCLVPLTCRFPKGSLKMDFLDIFLTTFFGLTNFGNDEGHLLLKMLKI